MKKRLLTITGVSILALVVAIVFGVIAPGQAYAKYTSKPKTTIKLSVEKPHYYVRFHANDDADHPAQGTMDDQTFTFGVAQTLTPNAYERNGYEFTGWNTMANGLGGDFEDGAEVVDLVDNPEEIYNLYAQWKEEGMHTEFEMNGTCIFHGNELLTGSGSGQITGNNCVVNGYDWANSGHTYIDTGIKLYDEENYNKDYEIGFTVVNYNSSSSYQYDPQSTFVNTKLEDGGRKYPGLVIRRNEKQIEITQSITWPNGRNDRKAVKGSSSAGTKVVIARVDGVVYYSFNGGAFQVLQDMNGSEDYFDTTVWFGAAEQADGTPFRYMDATLTDLYIKVGSTGSNKHIVSFDAGGVVDDPDDVIVVGSSKIGSLPIMSESVEIDGDTLFFNGWYTKPNGEGNRVTRDYVVSKDMLLYAYWRESDKLCGVDGSGAEYSSLQGCISAAGASDTITLLSDIVTQNVIVDSDKSITLDLNGFTISDDNVATMPVINNQGTLTVINGTMTTSMKAGVIDNTGKLHIGNGARIIATGIRQAVYNNGGELVISDGAYLASTSSSAERAAVHSKNTTDATAKVTITGGTIISNSTEAVKIEGGTLTIGTLGLPISREAPIIQGATYGVNTSVNITMYDGELRGKTAAINNANRITLTEVGASLIGINPEETAMIDGVVYKILYCQ